MSCRTPRRSTLVPSPYASLLLQDGESPAYVKEQMGHSSIQVTVDRYGHFIPGKNRGAVERLAAATSQPVGQPGEHSESVSTHSNFDATKTMETVNR